MLVMVTLAIILVVTIISVVILFCMQLKRANCMNKIPFLLPQSDQHVHNLTVLDASLNDIKSDLSQIENPGPKTGPKIDITYLNEIYSSFFSNTNVNDGELFNQSSSEFSINTSLKTHSELLGEKLNMQINYENNGYFPYENSHDSYIYTLPKFDAHINDHFMSNLIAKPTPASQAKKSPDTLLQNLLEKFEAIYNDSTASGLQPSNIYSKPN